MALHVSGVSDSGKYNNEKKSRIMEEMYTFIHTYSHYSCESDFGAQ